MMLQLATDLHDESEALFQLVSSMSDEDLQQQSQFKRWTINDILGHLHIWNWAADTSLMQPELFQEYVTKVMASVQQGRLREFEQEWLDGLQGRALRDRWRDFYRDMCLHFGKADPKARMKWVGPDMSVRSGITARLMEIWAHGQGIYDLLGVQRVDTDRIRNIVVLGANTFAWTFRNRRLSVPEMPPQLRLTAPSGEIWVFNDSNRNNRIEGNAVEFCQVVTQVRNIADTNLNVNGEVATQWMAIAQCFAGPPEDPPAPGSRFTNKQ